MERRVKCLHHAKGNMEYANAVMMSSRRLWSGNEKGRKDEYI